MEPGPEGMAVQVEELRRSVDLSRSHTEQHSASIADLQRREAVASDRYVRLADDVNGMGKKINDLRNEMDRRFDSTERAIADGFEKAAKHVDARLDEAEERHQEERENYTRRLRWAVGLLVPAAVGVAAFIGERVL